jgi:hypothetical protein
MSWDDTPEGTGQKRECTCGEMCKLIPLPENVESAVGIHHIWIHIHNCDTRCYPNSKNEIDKKATVYFI